MLNPTKTTRNGTGRPWADFTVISAQLWSTMVFLCWIFLIKLFPLLDNRGILSNPEETYNLNLSTVMMSIWSFHTQTTIFCTKICRILGLLSIPLVTMCPRWQVPDQGDAIYRVACPTDKHAFIWSREGEQCLWGGVVKEDTTKALMYARQGNGRVRCHLRGVRITQR